MNLIRASLTKEMNSIGMSLAHINTRSIVNKICFQQYICEQHIDVSVVTETWIKTDEIDMIPKEIPPPGYNILSHPCIMEEVEVDYEWYTKTILQLALTK